MAVISAALVTAGLAASSPAQADHVCYPAVCAAGDATATGLFCPTPIEHHERQTCILEVTNNGAGSLIHATLTMTFSGKSRHKRNHVFRGRIVIPSHGFDIFLGPDESTSLLFSVRARKPNKIASIVGCATAIPTDFNANNDCISTTRPTDSG